MWLALFVFSILISAFGAIRIFNYIQLDGYKVVKNKRMLYYSGGLICAVLLGTVCMVATALLSKGSIFDWICIIVLICPQIAFLILDTMQKRKTPLVVTRRIIRLGITFLIINAILYSILISCGKLLGGYSLLLPIGYVSIPLMAYLSLLINLPLENIIKHYYVGKAKEQVSNGNKILRIGITGSYGKTSVKIMLAKMLEKRYNVVYSKASYNTPMGAVMTIKEINSKTEILVMEMGARRAGDITEMCDIIKPDIGIITGITEQHMATFKSLNNIINTKFELIASLSNNGVAFFNGNNEYVRKMFARTTVPAKFLSLKNSGYVHAENIVIDIYGLKFDLHIGDNVYKASTKLIGEHNIENILLACNVANYLEISDTDIVKAIEELEFTPHRMEVLHANGLTIIDDTYNCNPVGAKRAIETLATFSNRKIVATQGIVELGNRGKEENYKIGLMLSGVADYVFAIGVNSKDIVEGLKDAHYNPTRIISVDNLEKAKELFPTVIKNGDVVLLMNDLPDNY